MRGLALRGLAAGRLSLGRLALLAGLATAGLTIGCTDSVRTSEPMYGSTAGAGGDVTAGAGGTLGTGGGAVGGAGRSGQAGSPGTGGVVATGGSGGAAGGPPVLAPPAPAGLVSLNTDYQGTSLSLLDSRGGVLKVDGKLQGDCVHSTTQGNGVSKTISGDAVLPSQPQRGGDIVIVDRGNGALTFVDPAACFIARQVAIPGGAKTNPHDVVILSDHKAYVTRYEANLTASMPQQMGNDVIAIDPVTGGYLSRINLDRYASTVAGAPVLARPDRAIIADGRVVVSLNQIDASYVGYGDGGVVIIDPATDMPVAAVSLPGLTDCEGMDFVPATHMLLVACGGSYGSKDQLLQSGIAVVDLGSSPPRLVQVVSSAAFDGHPISFGWVLAAPTAAAPNRAFAATYDPKGVAPDALYQFDFRTGVVAPVTTAATFAIGSAALADQLLFVPEALFKAPKVQLIDVSAGAQALSGFTPDTSGGLPPRQIAWY